MKDIFFGIVLVTVTTHFAFVAYFVVGGFLALRWPRTIWIHVPVAVWCVAIEIWNFVCPLTYLERWARQRAGMAPLAGDGFIDHYITGTLYPANAANLMVVVVVCVVLGSWVLFAIQRRRATSQRSASDPHLVRHDTPAG